MDLKEYIRDIPDFPEPGILFRDIPPLLRDPTAFKYAVDSLENLIQAVSFDTVVAVDETTANKGKQARPTAPPAPRRGRAPEAPAG